MSSFVNIRAVARVQTLLTGRLRATERASRVGLTVGIHEEEGSEKEEGSEATVAAIAGFHEDPKEGSVLPKRSWLLDGIDENQAGIDTALRRLGRQFAQNRIGIDSGYLQLGELVVLKLQQRIRASIPPALQPATVERKGSSTTLIDEGRMLASIRAKVTER